MGWESFSLYFCVGVPECVSVIPFCCQSLFSVHPETQPAGPPFLWLVPLRSPYPYAAESACEEKRTHTHYWMIWIQMTMAHLFVLWISYSKCLFHYIVQSVCLKTKWACHAPLPIMTTKTHRKWCVSACLSVCMLFCAHSDCVSFNSFIFRSNISWSCRFSSRQDSSSAFSAGSELLAESYTWADMMNKWEQWNIRHQVVLVA